LEKTAALLRTGCPNCGSRVFTTSLSSQIKQKIVPDTESSIKQNSYSSKFEIMPKVDVSKLIEDHIDEEDHIPSIKLREKGVYEVNIDGLFRDKKSDPVIVSGKPGIYRVELLQGSEEKSG
jgi:predicted  nucleic acid-binding Zn-ribbon protein